MKSQSYLLLLDRFTCIADRCPDNCCHGWDVPVDDTAYQQWQALEDDSVKQTLLASINTVNTVVVENATRHKIMQDADKVCTHLSATGLCFVQQQLGHSYLPEICREYPRVQAGGGGFLTDSASLSCPEMARLVVAAKNSKMLFTDNAATAREISEDNALAKVTGSLDKLCNTLLPIDAVPSGITLFYLVSTVLELMQAEPGQPISLLLNKTANASSKTLSKRLKSLEGAYQAGKLNNYDQGGKLFWSFVTQLCLTDKLPEFKTLLQKNGLDGLSAQHDVATQDAAWLKLKSFVATHKRQPALRKWTPALRRYLIVKLRNHGFPHAPVEGNFLVNLLDCTVALASIQLWMWLLAKEKKTITEDELATIIYKVERISIHNDVFYQQLNKNPQLLDMSAYIDCIAGLG